MLSLFAHYSLSNEGCSLKRGSFKRLWILNSQTSTLDTTKHCWRWFKNSKYLQKLQMTTKGEDIEKIRSTYNLIQNSHWRPKVVWLKLSISWDIVICTDWVFLCFIVFCPYSILCCLRIRPITLLNKSHERSSICVHIHILACGP